MDESVQLVCEILRITEDDEVSVEEACLLYQKVFLTEAKPDDVRRAMAQVSAQNGGLTCSGRSVIQVLLTMEKDRESRNELYWELQILKSSRYRVSDGTSTQPLKHHTKSPVGIKCFQKRDKKQWRWIGLLHTAGRLFARLDLDGIWSVLPSRPHNNVSRRLGWKSPTSSDILLLLQYKYDVIKKQLYREMLQDEHGVEWWDSMGSQEQMDRLCDLEEAAEHAFKRMDWLSVSELPGALRCYRSSERVILQAYTEVVKPKDQAWSLKPKESAWSAAVFLSEVESYYQDERHSLTVLLNRVGRAVLTEVYLSLCVAVRRAERETRTQTALLVSRQRWDKWPYTRSSGFQDLAKWWLQENGDPTKSWRTAGCTQQQAVLQYLVRCQENEKQSLLEILHTLSLDELQNQSHMLLDPADLRQGCVFTLRQIKSSPQGVQESPATRLPVSWADCAVHLLTRLTQAHDNEARTVVHTLPVMDAAALMALLHKYECELQSPKLTNLRELLQLHTSRGTDTLDTAPLTSSKRAEEEPRQDHPVVQDQSNISVEPEICTGCGVVLAPEDAPYLEILSAREHRDEESTERMEAAGEKEKTREGPENDEAEIAVEKQGSLITLAWSKPVESTSEDKEITPVEKMPTDSPQQQNNTEPGYGQTHSKHCDLVQQNTEHELTVTSTENKLLEPLQDESTLSTDAIGKADEDVSKPEARQPDAENSKAGLSDTQEARSVDEVQREEACSEEQQLQREATMRSLVDIQRRAELRCHQDRERQILRVQERLAIIQNRKSDEDLLGLTREDTFRHLTSTLRREDGRQQKTLVREKLQKLWRERSCVLQSKRERNTAGFKELLAPTAQCTSDTDEGSVQIQTCMTDTHGHDTHKQ